MAEGGAPPPGAQGLPKRRRSYTIKEKLCFLNDLDTAIANHTVANWYEFADNYHIPYATFRKWNRQELENMADKKVRKHRTDHNGRWPQMEDQLYEWVLQMREKRLPLAINDIQEMAEEFFNLWWENLPAGQREELLEKRPVQCHFRASYGWAYNYMERKHISFRKITKNSSTIPADAALRIELFQNNVTGLIDHFTIELDFIINMDETFLLLDFPPAYTVNTKGDKQVDVRTSRCNPKLGCTVTLTVTASGRKLKAHVTFPRRGFVHQLDDLEAAGVPDNVIFTSSNTGWMRHDTLEHWREEALEPYINQQRGVDGENHFLLIVDRASVHRNDEFGVNVTGMMGTLDFIPAGCTCLSQPLDLTVMRSFKSNVRKQWKDWKKTNTNNEGGCRNIELHDVLNSMISVAWEAVPLETIQNGFRVMMRRADADQAGVDENNNLAENADAADDADDGMEFNDFPDEDNWD